MKMVHSNKEYLKIKEKIENHEHYDPITHSTYITNY